MSNDYQISMDNPFQYNQEETQIDFSQLDNNSILAMLEDPSSFNLESPDSLSPLLSSPYLFGMDDQPLITTSSDQSSPDMSPARELQDQVVQAVPVEEPKETKPKKGRARKRQRKEDGESLALEYLLTR